MKLHLILNLKKPVRVSLGTPSWKGEDVNGLYEWNNNNGGYHDVTISSTIVWGTKQFNDIMAHEYIHAWQCEMGLKLSHGRVFKWWAEKLAEYGYSISKRQ